MPDDAQMGFTVRSYKPDVRQHRLAGIERGAKAEAMAAGAEKPPLVEKYESTSAVYNDPVLTQHLAATLEGVLGKGSVVTEDPIMRSEEHTSELQSRPHLVCRLLLEKKKKKKAQKKQIINNKKW